MAKRIPRIFPPNAPTKGPWYWFGNTRNDEVYLAAPWGGRHLVMSFKRWGMAGAQPCFYANGLRQDVGAFAEYERDYRDDVIGIDHPDARLIAAAPTLLALVKEAAEIMQIVYADNFPAGIEGFLVRADATVKGICGALPQAVDAVAGTVDQRKASQRA